MASPPGSPSSRWWNRPIKPEPAIGPTELEVETMVAGDGYRYAKPGMTVSVHYVGYLPDGRVFDATHRRGAPLRPRALVGREHGTGAERAFRDGSLPCCDPARQT